MNTFAFILGRNPQLSIAELRATLPSVPHYGDGLFALADCELAHPQDYLNTLGGTLKIFEIQNKFAKLEEVQDALINHLQNKFEYQENKSSWGLSVFGISQNKLRHLLMNTKKSLRKAKISARFVNKNFQNLNTASTVKEHLISESNTELAIFLARDEYLLGEIRAVQDIDSYSVRDYDRPARSAKAGMFPPKLAQILLNLSSVQARVYDPFCGSGTVLTEALVRGLEVTGSDISQEQVEDTQENCAWISQKFQTKKPGEIFVHDATQKFPELKFDAIVTEGFLGTPLTRPLDPKKSDAHRTPIEKIYLDFFSEISQIMPKGTKLVITFPFFRGGRSEIFLSEKLLTHAQSCGLEILSNHIAKPNEKRPSLFYFREDQFVGREVWVLRKQ